MTIYATDSPRSLSNKLKKLATSDLLDTYRNGGDDPDPRAQDVLRDAIAGTLINRMSNVQLDLYNGSLTNGFTPAEEYDLLATVFGV